MIKRGPGITQKTVNYVIEKILDTGVPAKECVESEDLFRVIDESYISGLITYTFYTRKPRSTGQLLGQTLAEDIRVEPQIAIDLINERKFYPFVQ